MKAVICKEFGEATVAEVERPTPDPKEVLVKVLRVQLSVTECQLFRGERVAHYETVAERIDRGDGRLFGHEFCGRVLEVGADITGLSEGDRVYAPGKIPCDTCKHCRTGFELHCPNKMYIGYDRPGALAEYAAFSAAALTRIPSGVTDAEAAALQPLASSLLAVREAAVGFGDVVAVIGTGVMGYQCGQLALQRGADRVYAVDVDAEKLAIAAERGLEPIDASGGDPVEELTERTDGVGVDLTFEAVGGDQTHGSQGSDPLARSLQATRSGGAVVQVGYIAGDLPVTPREFRTKSIDWINPTTGVIWTSPNTHTGEHVARLVADGRVDIDAYVTHEVSGLNSVTEAVRITLNKQRHGARGPPQIVL